jgi:hypothetical protein
MQPLEIAEIDTARVAFAPVPWAFAQRRRGDIDAHFVARQRERSGVWNGRVLLLNDYAVQGRAFSGRCFETDYASFDAWRHWDFPDRDVYNFFAAAALRGSDGAFLVGEMASYTANAGALYFPCGTPEPADVGPGGALDLADNLSRELLEETGIAIGELAAAPGWTMVRDGCYLGLLKQLTARQSAAELRDRMLRHNAREPQPEFADVRIVRGPGDFHPRMPPFVIAFLERVWRP